MLGKARFFILVSAICIASGWSGASAAEAPPKPLRERLLERALKGDAEAQFDLAKGYEGGRYGLTQDFAQAQHWFQEAANQGDAFAEASLGIFYGFGKGVKKNYVLAYIWLNRSASHLNGPERDSVLETRDSIGRRMTAAELERARSVSLTGKVPSQ